MQPSLETSLVGERGKRERETQLEHTELWLFVALGKHCQIVEQLSGRSTLFWSLAENQGVITISSLCHADQKFSIAENLFLNYYACSMCTWIISLEVARVSALAFSFLMTDEY